MPENIYTGLIDCFGEQTQINKIQEELLELALALNQVNCPTKNREEIMLQIHGELADVRTMLHQASHLFNNSLIDKLQHDKLVNVAVKYLGYTPEMAMRSAEVFKYFPGEEQRTEHNANVIGAFMDHYKDLTGLEIPEEVYESFFNA